VTWSTTDLDTEGGQWSYDGSAGTIKMPSEYEIPVPDGTFDVVLSGNVIEHVRQPWRWMTELARVVRPGGLVITIAPVSWVYHEAPLDCFRYYPDGLAAISEHAGLTVEHAWWGTLEPSVHDRTYPGIGQDWAVGYGRKRKVLSALARVGVKWPLPVAYDVVSVARKL
jgi:SAM-dependent methyltransferase